MQVNNHLARRCQSQSRPFLPIDRHMFRFVVLGYALFVKKKGSLFELAEIEIIDKLEKHRLPYPVKHHIYFAPPHEDAQNRAAITGQNRHRTQQTNAYF